MLTCGEQALTCQLSRSHILKQQFLVQLRHGCWKWLKIMLLRLQEHTIVSYAHVQNPAQEKSYTYQLSLVQDTGCHLPLDLGSIIHCQCSLTQCDPYIKTTYGDVAQTKNELPLSLPIIYLHYIQTQHKQKCKILLLIIINYYKYCRTKGGAGFDDRVSNFYIGQYCCMPSIHDNNIRPATFQKGVKLQTTLNNVVKEQLKHGGINDTFNQGTHDPQLLVPTCLNTTMLQTQPCCSQQYLRLTCTWHANFPLSYKHENPYNKHINYKPKQNKVDYLYSRCRGSMGKKKSQEVALPKGNHHTTPVNERKSKRQGKLHDLLSYWRLFPSGRPKLHSTQTVTTPTTGFALYPCIACRVTKVYALKQYSNSIAFHVQCTGEACVHYILVTSIACVQFIGVLTTFALGIQAKICSQRQMLDRFQFECTSQSQLLQQYSIGQLVKRQARSFASPYSITYLWHIFIFIMEWFMNFIKNNSRQYVLLCKYLKAQYNTTAPTMTPAHHHTHTHAHHQQYRQPPLQVRHTSLLFTCQEKQNTWQPPAQLPRSFHTAWSQHC